jgi:hypothetical protein
MCTIIWEVWGHHECGTIRFAEMETTPGGWRQRIFSLPRGVRFTDPVADGVYLISIRYGTGHIRFVNGEFSPYRDGSTYRFIGRALVLDPVISPTCFVLTYPPKPYLVHSQ